VAVDLCSAIQQFWALQPDCVLADPSRIAWIDNRTGNLQLRITEEWIDPCDGHLGYTQIVRLFELARHVAWKKLLEAQTAGNSIVSDCTVVKLGVDFSRRIDSGVYELPSVTSLRGRTSFHVGIQVIDTKLNSVCASADLVCVALDDLGRPADIRQLILQRKTTGA
jgi:acyl-CoA thioesterase FadM